MPTPPSVTLSLGAGLAMALLVIGLGTAAAQTTAPTPSAPATTPAPAPAKPVAKPAKKKPAPTKPAAAAPAKPAATPPLTPAAAATTAPNEAQSLSAGSGPIDITSDDSLELQQSNKVYVARGNAIAKRADRTVYGDVLMAYYRDIPNSNQTEIWRVVADGHVKITTPTQSVVGDHGVYDLDTKTAVMTGKGLTLTTPQDVVTARDSLEWYDDKQLAVARGDALAVRTDRRVRGDVLQALIATAPGQAQRISRVDAAGHVLVSGPEQVGTGDTGVYNLDTGIATLVGHVTLARGENTLVGQYGVIDLQRGVSHLLPRAPGSGDATHGRVQGYMVPQKKTHPDAKAKPATPPTGGATATPQTATPDPAQKAQTDPAKAR